MVARTRLGGARFDDPTPNRVVYQGGLTTGLFWRGSIGSSSALTDMN